MKYSEDSALDLVKWLRVLMYIAATGIVISLVNFLPFVPSLITTWLSRGVTAAIALSLLRLAPANGRYRTAGILRGVVFGCTMLSAVVSAASVLSFPASILSLIAVYQEYSAHSELVAARDPKLSGKWNSLFNWGIIAAVFLSVGSMVMTMILVAANPEGGTALISTIVLAILGLPGCVLDLVYIRYIQKMIRIFDCEEPLQEG